MDIITLDFETYYDQDYSLGKLTTQEYILDPRFEVIMVGVKVNDGLTRAITGWQKAEAYLKTLDWGNAMLVCHNTMFDGAILNWRMNIQPKLYFCTMMGARPNIVPYTYRGQMSLKVVSDHIGVGAKGTEVGNAKGLRLADMTQDFITDYELYCIKDVNLTHSVLREELKGLPRDEVKMIDLTLRKFIHPTLRLDKDVIESAQVRVLMEKEAALGDAGLKDREILMSNPKFADALINLGVTPPTKTSLTTGQQTYAFAKTDEGMQALLHHDNPQVRLLCEARLKHKSTIEETRLARFSALAELNAPFAVPLLYYGAHTGRFSGFDKLNLQNLGRVSPLRKAITAPPAHKLVVGDLSQIEARITACLAGQKDLIDAFAVGEDVYSLFAANKLYNKLIEKVTKPERFIGKMSILGLGFGMGAPKFKDSVRAMGGVEITLGEAQRTVKAYRTAYPHIVKLWYKANDAIQVLANGGEMQIGPCTVMKGKIRLPNGMYLHYPNVYQDASGDWWYTYREGQKKIYGGIIVENIVQALARIILVAAELRLAKRGYNASLSVHDELIYAIPDKKADLFALALKAALIYEVDWMPGLPLDAEVDIGKRYSEAK